MNGWLMFNHLHNKVISSKKLQELTYDPLVKSMTNLGVSGDHPKCDWWDIQFWQGRSLDVFVKREE